jgi:signal transduction histidine kinase
LIACLVVLASLNGAYLAYSRRLRRTGPNADEGLEKCRRSLHLQMVGDLFLLTLLLYFSGGATNPLLLLYLFHLAIGSILFSGRPSHAYALAALVLPWSLYGLEWIGTPEKSPWAGMAWLSPVHERLVLAAYSIVAAGLWFFLTRLVADLRTKEEDLRQAHDQLRFVKEDLEQLDAHKNHFLRRVVFQLKNPVIEMDLELASIERSLSPRQVKALEPLRATRKRVWSLLELIDDLVWLSKLTVQDVPFRKRTIDVYETVRERVQVLEEEATLKGFHFQIHGDPQLRLEADPEAFGRVADHLLSNAVKYTPAGAHPIIVEFSVQDEWLRFSVRDEGVGIPEKQKAKLFEEFFRASNARTMEKFGTGLGLVLVKRILDWHGGRIQIQSVPQRGTLVETLWPWKATGEVSSQSPVPTF